VAYILRVTGILAEFYFTTTHMRNFLIGLFLGAALTAGVGVSAGAIKGPQLSGGSGPLKYAVIEGDEVVCVTPWVNVKEKTIECYTENPDSDEQVNPEKNVAE
jgi:hypothetical protein